MKLIHHELGRDALYKIWNYSPENTIIYFFSDGGSLVFRDEIYPIERGAICFIRAGTIHYTMPDEPRLYDRSKIYLSVKRTDLLFDAVGDDSKLKMLFGSSSAVYARLPRTAQNRAEKLFSLARDGLERGGEAVGVSAFLSLLDLISEHAVHYIKEPKSFMERAIKYINSNYSEAITLDDLCRAASVSKSCLCRRFKSTMGMTVSEYLLKTRIAAAKGLLIRTELSISQISEECGFSSISYFCQAFRIEVGVTALKYKKEHGASN